MSDIVRFPGKPRGPASHGPTPLEAERIVKNQVARQRVAMLDAGARPAAIDHECDELEGIIRAALGLPSAAPTAA